MDKNINTYVEILRDEIINSTCEIINIPSVFSDADAPDIPFGKNTLSALNYMLDLGKKFGFSTKNIDNKCGYIEFGEGDKLLGIVAHLDVVPVDDSWTYSPFNSTIDNNKIYGRGAIDDKGPAIATLYAMKIVSDNYNINKRVRLILGLNEENDWKYIERYKQTEEIPSISFSPDANFPCIYAEKTIESIFIKEIYKKDEKLYIKSISTNNNAINVVPKFCEVDLCFESSISNTIEDVLKNIISSYNYNITFERIGNRQMKLISKGIASHAAHPELGDNAISKLIIVLNDLFTYYSIPVDILNYFVQYIGDDYTGKNLEINFNDESGYLTLNTAQFSLKDDNLTIGFNLRIPVTIDYNKIKDSFRKNCTDNIDVIVSRIQEPLYISKDNNLVKTLCDIFNKYNNTHFEPQAIGGGTYSRAFDNCISFGPQMPGEKDMCHQSDEYISIDNLLFCCKVYTEAILSL